MRVVLGMAVFLPKAYLLPGADEGYARYKCNVVEHCRLANRCVQRLVRLKDVLTSCMSSLRGNYRREYSVWECVHPDRNISHRVFDARHRRQHSFYSM